MNEWPAAQSFAVTDATLVFRDNGSVARVPNAERPGAFIQNRSSAGPPMTVEASWDVPPETVCAGDSAPLHIHAQAAAQGVHGVSIFGFWLTVDPAPLAKMFANVRNERGAHLAKSDLVMAQNETRGDADFTLTVDDYVLSLNDKQPLPFRVVFLADKRVAVAWQYTPGGAPAEIKDPLIFIPGVTGSQLVAVSDNHILWPPEGPGASRGVSNRADIARDFTRLSLNPNTGPHEDIVATDVIRADGTDIYYESLLNYLKNEGRYREYAVNKDPKRRTLAGCDKSQTDRSLFVFAYDWRRDNADTAKLLADYVQCVKALRPKKPITIVAHSMGGLVARRYIIDNVGEVQRLITVASPFLGSAKPLYQMLLGTTGLTWSDTGTHLLFSAELKEMLSYYPGVHQLMASKAYYDLDGRPYQVLPAGGVAQILEYAGVNGAAGIVASTFNKVSYNSKLPNESNEAFHSYSYNGNSQDNWSGDKTGVDYFHIVGVQAAGDTPLLLQDFRDGGGHAFTFVRYGPGDGTVPQLSAERRGGTRSFNAERSTIRVFSTGPDALLEHTGLASNPEAQKQILDWLRAR